MHKILTTVAVVSLIVIPLSVDALTQVDGHYRDGTYVEPHYRSDPDGYEYNNLGSDGIDVDGDGYGAGWTNPRYESDIDRSWLNDSYRDTYNSYDSGYDSYDSYDSGLDSYDYGSSYDSYDSYNSYDYGSSYDSYDSYDYGYDSYESGYDTGYYSY